ncbi:uncharacterized protein [Macrobrachium rosenbergii]|uniref:uncharacterized protein n=1 Tax=Macrobrachium rosenbergii TaxID=79674 RepID=UPI0034D40388
MCSPNSGSSTRSSASPKEPLEENSGPSGRTSVPTTHWAKHSKCSQVCLPKEPLERRTLGQQWSTQCAHHTLGQALVQVPPQRSHLRRTLGQAVDPVCPPHTGPAVEHSNWCLPQCLPKEPLEENSGLGPHTLGQGATCHTSGHPVCPGPRLCLWEPLSLVDPVCPPHTGPKCLPEVCPVCPPHTGPSTAKCLPKEPLEENSGPVVDPEPHEENSGPSGRPSVPTTHWAKHSSKCLPKGATLRRTLGRVVDPVCPPHTGPSTRPSASPGPSGRPRSHTEENSGPEPSTHRFLAHHQWLTHTGPSTRPSAPRSEPLRRTLGPPHPVCPPHWAKHFDASPKEPQVNSGEV